MIMIGIIIVISLLVSWICYKNQGKGYKEIKEPGIGIIE